jgi:murein L,D-transpeptidase YafK
MIPSVDIIIYKTERRLVLSTSDGERREYSIALGRNWTVDKAVEGDHATPVGDFHVCAKNPRSKYFLSLCLSYPNAEDAERGLAAGLISRDEHVRIIEAIRLGKVPPQHTRLGGEIYIHGRGGHAATAQDWTRGCIALDDAAMQEVYASAVIGTPVRIIA